MFFSNSAVKVHDSQAYKNGNDKGTISFTFDSRDMLLTPQMVFSFVRTAVACAILQKTSGLEPFSETIARIYLKLVTVSSFFLFFNLYRFLDAIGVVCNQFGVFGTDLHFIPCAGFVETFY